MEAIFRSVPSRTMSPADRLRSWSSAEANTFGEHDDLRSGGTKAGKKVRHEARKQMQIRSKVGSRKREVISSQSQRYRPQSRADTHQTDVLRGEWGAEAHEQDTG